MHKTHPKFPSSEDLGSALGSGRAFFVPAGPSRPKTVYGAATRGVFSGEVKINRVDAVD